MKQVALNDESHFQLIGGLWKGERAPLKLAKVLRATNFGGDGLLHFDDVVELEVEERHFSERRLAHGDIVVERSGGGPKQPVGRVALFVPPDDRPYFSSNFTTTLRVRDRDTFDPDYVALYLHALYLDGATETLQRATTGIRNLDWREYLRLEIPVRRLDEQKKLSQLIGGVRRACRVEHDLIGVLVELKRATMTRLFMCGLRDEAQKETGIGLVPESWTEVSIADFGEIVTGTTPPTKERVYYDDGNIPFISPGDIEHGMPVELTQKCITDAGLAVSRSLPMGATCVVCIGSTIGKVGRTTAKVSATNQQINAVVPGAGYDPSYLSHLLTYQSGIVRNAASPSPVPILSKGAFEKLVLFTSKNPDEQREIAAILDAIDHKIALHRQKHAVLEELFQSLLHKLMTGEIRVADLDLSALPAAPAEAAEVTA